MKFRNFATHKGVVSNHLKEESLYINRSKEPTRYIATIDSSVSPYNRHLYYLGARYIYKVRPNNDSVLMLVFSMLVVALMMAVAVQGSNIINHVASVLMCSLFVMCIRYIVMIHESYLLVSNTFYEKCMAFIGRRKHLTPIQALAYREYVDCLR